MKTLTANHTALVVIDVQDGIVKQGELHPYSGEQIIATNNQLIEKFTAQGALVVLVTVDFTTFKYLNAKYDVAVPENYQQLSTTFDEAANVIQVTKHNPGAFFGTDLDLQLRRRGIDTIVLTGVSTTNGVYATAIDAFQQGYQLKIVADAMADRDEALHQVVLDKMFPKLGEVVAAANVELS